MQIPLFPLPNVVLFPQIMLPLHIFEERYKLMINRCVDSEEVFGIVRLEPGSPESPETIGRVGVAARVVQVERLEGGRMNILCAGESRFRVVERTDPVRFKEFLKESQEAAQQRYAVYQQLAGITVPQVKVTIDDHDTPAAVENEE